MIVQDPFLDGPVLVELLDRLQIAPTFVAMGI